MQKLIPMASKRKLNSSTKSDQNSMSITTTTTSSSSSSSSSDDEQPVLSNRPQQQPSDSDSDESSFETPPKNPSSKSDKTKGKIDEVSKKKKKRMRVEKIDKGSKSDDDDGEIQKTPKSKKSHVVIGAIEKGSKVNKSKVSDVDKDSKGKKSKVSNGDEEGSKKIEKGSKSKVSSDEEDSDEGSKVNKTNNSISNGGGEEAVKKAAAFSRVWTEEDELVLLDVMSKYKLKGGHDPIHGVDGFYEQVKDMLSFAVTKAQMSSKVSRLKKKFQNAVMKAGDGAEPVFSRPFDIKCYELSKKVWGDDPKLKTVKKMDDDNVGSEVPTKSVVKKVINFEEENESSENYWSLYPRLCAGLELEASKYLTLPQASKEGVKKKIGAIGKAKARELEEEWKSLDRMQFQVYAKRAALISKLTQAALDVIDRWN